MKLEQHIYTSAETEFATAAATQGINRDNRIKLENHSLYVLPGSLLYKDDRITPVKHVFYPLDEYQFVVGRAVYIGKDSLGRPGNYLFHNFIISKEDLISLHSNPVRLIKWLASEGIVRDKVPEQSIDVLEISPDEIRESRSSVPLTEPHLVLNLLQFCFNHKSLQNPLLLAGTDEECLDFLDCLYKILPYDLRECLSFDTYAYGVNLGFQIIGMPDGPEFQQSLSYSLRLNLSNRRYTANFQLKEPSNLISFIAENVVAGKIEEINSVHSLGHHLKKGDYIRFKEGYDIIPPEFKNFLYTSYRQTILNHILTHKDEQLLEMTKQEITAEDMSVLSSDFEIIKSLLARREKRIIETFVEWLCIKGDRVEYCSLLFDSADIWKTFLEKIATNPRHMPVLLDAVRILPEHYSRELEEALIEGMLKLLPHMVLDKSLAIDFFKVLDKLSMSCSEQIGLLKTFVKYELSKDSLLLERMIDSDLSVLSQEYQTSVLDSILRGILKTGKLEEIPQQLSKLFDRAQDKMDYILRLIALTEGLQLSDRTKKVLKATLLEFLNQFHQDETTEQIKYKIENLVDSKPSFFKRIWGK